MGRIPSFDFILLSLKFVHVVFMEVIEESGFRFFEVFSKGVGIRNMDLGSNFLLTGLRLNQPANVIRHVSILGNNDVI